MKLSQFIQYSHDAIRRALRVLEKDTFAFVELHLALVYGGMGPILTELNPTSPLPNRPEEVQLRGLAKEGDEAAREAWLAVLVGMLGDIEAAVRSLDSEPAHSYLLNSCVFELAQSRGNLKKYLSQILEGLEGGALQGFLGLVRASSTPLQWSEWLPFLPANLTSPELQWPGLLTPWLRGEGVAVDLDGFISARGDSRGRTQPVLGDLVVSFLNDVGKPVQVSWRNDQVAEVAAGSQVSFVAMWRDHWQVKGPSSLRSFIIQDKARKFQVYSASGNRYYDDGTLYYSYANLWPRRPVRFPTHRKDAVVPHDFPWVSADGTVNSQCEVTIKHLRDITIFEISNVISSAEIDSILSFCRAQEQVQSPEGRSPECFVSNVEGEVFRNATSRMYQALGSDYQQGCDQCETPYVNVYLQGSHGPIRGYAQPPFSAPNHSHTEEGSNRYATVLVWLSEVEGGALTFPRVLVDGRPLRFEARKGTAIGWYNLYPDGNLNPYAVTAHEPVTKGDMWVSSLTCWDFVLGETHSWNSRNRNNSYAVPFVVQVDRDDLT